MYGKVREESVENVAGELSGKGLADSLVVLPEGERCSANSSRLAKSPGLTTLRATENGDLHLVSHLEVSLGYKQGVAIPGLDERARSRVVIDRSLRLSAFQVLRTSLPRRTGHAESSELVIPEKAEIHPGSSRSRVDEGLRRDVGIHPDLA